MLFRAHSLRYIIGSSGVILNKNLERIRKPRDTDPRLHHVATEWFNRKFGKDYRSLSLFCTGNVDIARGYLTSEKALIELQPIGDFSLCFSSKCKDMFGHFQFKPPSFFESVANIENELEELEFLECKNEGVAISAQSGSEVMVIARSFQYRRIS